MGRRVAHLFVREEMTYNTHGAANFAAANAILMRIAARLDARKNAPQDCKADNPLLLTADDASCHAATTDERIN